MKGNQTLLLRFVTHYVCLTILKSTLLSSAPRRPVGEEDGPGQAGQGHV